jgi:hypothetical protein
MDFCGIFQYQDLIRDEHKEFQHHARKVFEFLTAKKFWNKIGPDVKRYVDECYDSKLKRIDRFDFP